MKNKLIIIICIAFAIITTVSIATAGIGGGGGISGIPYYISHAIMPSVDDSFELGGASNRWTKIWGKDLDISGIFTLGGTVGTGGIDMNGEDLTMGDNASLYLDTAKTRGIRYNSSMGDMQLIGGNLWSSGEFYIGANSGEDGSGNWEPNFRMQPTGRTLLSNVSQGNAADRHFDINFTDSVRINSGGLHLTTIGSNKAIIEADNIATTNKTFQFPNISGTLVTTAGAGATINLGAYTFKVGDATNYTEIKNDGEINLHGTARVERHLRVGAAQWDGGSSAPSASFEGVFPTLDFDNTTDDEASYTLIVPYRWDSTTDIEFAIDWFYDGTQDNGTVSWNLEYKGIKAGEAVTGAGTTITQTSAGTHTTGQMVRTIFTTKILASNLEAEDTLGFRLFRDVSEDTLGTNARLINTHFHFKMNKLGKSL